MPLTGRSTVLTAAPVFAAAPVFPPASAFTSPSCIDSASEAREHLEQLVHLLLPVPRVARANRLRHARSDVPAEEELLHLLHRSLHGGELEQDVHAVLVLLHHPLDALHLALDAPEAPERLGPRVLVDHRVPPVNGARARSIRATWYPASATKMCLIVWPLTTCPAARMAASSTSNTLAPA